MAKSIHIDIGLAVLEVITPKGHTWSQAELADICGCPRNTMHLIEKRAIQKLAANPLLKTLHSEIEK